MKKLLFAAALVLASFGASASVVCTACEYTGNPASNLGLHNTITEDSSTFSNATTGTNGSFSNLWVFDIAPAGAASVTATFLPIGNISNFDASIYAVDAATCNANTAITAGSCSFIDLGALLIDGQTPVNWATGFDFGAMDAGRYAIMVSGTISGLGATQPASYTGNLQVQQQAVPEPGTLALAGLSLFGLGLTRRRK